MNCPKCARPNEEEQNFCRDCGAELIPSRSNSFRMAGLGVLAMMFAGLLVAIFGKMFDMRWLAYLGLVVLFAGAFIFSAYEYLKGSPIQRRRTSRADGPTLAPLVEKADTTNKLLTVGEVDYIPSAVEETTELLERPAKR